MLSDFPLYQKYKSSKRRPVNTKTNKRWADSQKLEAVTTYLMLGGSIRLTANALKISEDTLYVWRRSEWWNDLLRELQKEEKIELGTRLKKVINKSWDIVGDRLENGDHVYNQKTGELIRKPVSLRDASKVAVDAALLRDKLQAADTYSTATDNIADKLAKLAKSFSDLSKGITNQAVAEDVEFKDNAEAEEGTDDAVYDEREEGLQTGKPSLQLEALTEETTK